MLRYQSNMRAILIAALTILVCLVCLTGATLALFTSNEEDGTIGIITTAGDVAVDIVDATDGKTSLVGTVLQFQTSAENSEVLFEPGATFRTQGFQIKNIGSVPVNFRLYVSRDEEMDMDAFLEAFDIWLSADPSKPDAARELNEFEGSLAVGANTEETYYLFIKMKENAGNEFQNRIYTGIGVTVYAVQGNVAIGA